MKVDFTKPYGEVYGSSAGHRYEQGGRLFDAQGNLMPEPALDALAEAQPKTIAATGALIYPPNSDPIALPTDREALLALANSLLATKLHPLTGAAKISRALLDAFPAKVDTADQVDQQLAAA